MSGSKFKSGVYEPKNFGKYKGNYPIKYRSSWELLFMRWCDKEPRVVEWGSESSAVPYVDPLVRENKNPMMRKIIRRYKVDFNMTVRDKVGNIKKYLVEIKPWRQTQKPVRRAQSDRTFLYEVLTYARNKAKWEAAVVFAKAKGAEFMVLTERDFLSQ